MPPLLFVTGFGAFERVERNPSAEIAQALGSDPPAGVEIHATILPVTFRGCGAAADRALAALAPRVPDVLLSLGVHPGSAFRLERRARARPKPGRPDSDGETADTLGPADGTELESPLDPEPLADALRAAGAAEVVVSSDAGGYVCERIYHHMLAAGARLGIPALFLHVPPLAAVELPEQVRVVRALVSELARRA